MERILAGEAGVRGDLVTSDMAVGHVIDLDSAENNETVRLDVNYQNSYLILTNHRWPGG